MYNKCIFSVPDDDTCLWRACSMKASVAWKALEHCHALAHQWPVVPLLAYQTGPKTTSSSCCSSAACGACATYDDT